MKPCAPKLTDKSKRPRSKVARWRVISLLIVHLLIAVHIAHWWTTGRTLSPLEPSEAMEFTKHGVVNAGLLFFALTALSTLVLGRFFCGWACHLVALQDLSRWALGKVGIRPRPLRSRTLALVPVLAFGYMFLLPLWSRPETPQTSYALTTGEFWSTFPPWWGALLTFFVCGFLVVYLLGAKGFCTYGCPYGALFGAVDRLAPGRIRVDDSCEGCGLCTATCSSNVDVKREVATHGMVVDTGCMKCLDCVSVCPKGALSFGFGAPALARGPVRGGKGRSWQEELVLALVFVATFLATRGLYGVVPFLLALGLAGAGAGVALGAWRRGGRWRVVAAAGAVFLAHSGVVQGLGHRSQSAFETLQDARGSFFTMSRSQLDPEQRAAADRVIESGGRALAWSLLPDARREVELGWARILVGDLEAGEEHLAAAAAATTDPVTLLELGNLRRLQGDEQGALSHYEEAHAAAPGRPLARAMLRDLCVELGDKALAAGRPGAAEPRFTRALELTPDALDVRAALVELRLSRGDREGALGLLEEGVRLAPEDPAPLRVLAFTHLSLGEPESAAEVCSRAAKLPDPEGETARLVERIEAELRR